MVLNKKQQRKHRNNRRGTKRFAAGCSARKSKQTRMLQSGGVSPACVFNGASGADVLYRNAGANIHNTNPQASLDLDNKFMSYGGAVPLGNNILQGGAANCGDEGRGGAGNGKSETFKQYLEGLENQYMIGGESAPMQNAGGFSTDPSEYIAGLPVYKAYDDCCPPAIVNNQLVMGAPDQPVCGLGAIKGGARRRAPASRKHKHSSKSRRNSKRKNNNRRTRHNNHSKRQRGGAVGDFVYSATKSTPAPMADAFNGPQGVFRYPDDMMTRTFNEVQPNYSVNAI